MPELPEVEVVKRSLEKKIQNLIIKKVKIIDGNLRYKVNKDLIPKLVGKRIRQIERRSKYLILKINFDLFLLVHLGMTGKFFFINSKKKRFKTSFYYKVQKKKDKRYDKIVFFFKKNQKLIYNDIRKFGFIKLYAKSEYSEISHLKKLGPEPLKNEFNFNYFKKKIINKNRMVKDVMMDQTFLSGLGNIYVNEILFLSKVRPTRKVKYLKNSEIKEIIKNTKKILKNSIKLGGSSIKNFSSDDGKKGIYQQFFKVYARNNKTCSNTDCNNSIIRIVISNRASFFCKNCQK